MGAPLNHLLAGVATDGHAAECAGAFSAAGGGAHPRLHGKLPVFVSRNDMGNYAHHLGDLLSVFQVFDHLKLQPQHAQEGEKKTEIQRRRQKKKKRRRRRPSPSQAKPSQA